MNHDVVAIGASSGGIEVLMDLVELLPADLAASLFVAVHTLPGRTSELPELLARRGRLEARHPIDGEAIAPRTIYVAPPDMHLTVRGGTMGVARGPKENGHRPSVDVLFRTAAAAYGPRVIGVVLSGYLDCGTAGLLSIKARGGLCVAQDPATASAPDMPRHAIQGATVDHVVAPSELAALLVRLVGTPAGSPGEPNAFVQQLEGTQQGPRAEIVCPICDGVLTEAQPGVFQHFRCHVGHAFSLEGLVAEQSEELERVLWAAVRALEESAALARRVGAHEVGELKRRFEEKANTHMQQADYIRNMLLYGGGLKVRDASKL